MVDTCKDCETIRVQTSLEMACSAHRPKSDYQAWRALLQRCMSELGLVADPAGAFQGVMKITVDESKASDEAFVCGTPSGLDLVAAVDECLERRSNEAKPVSMGRPHAVCLADQTPCDAPDCPARAGVDYCCSLLDLAGRHDPMCELFGRTPGVAQADCHSCNGAVACKRHRRTGRATPTSGDAGADRSKATPACVATSDWGCEARRLLGIARGALTFYADPLEWGKDGDALADEGKNARAALDETAMPALCRPDAPPEGSK